MTKTKKPPAATPKKTAGKPARGRAAVAKNVDHSRCDWIASDLRPLAVPVENLALDDMNAREHAAKDLTALAESLKRFGQRTPLVVNARTGVIEKGNGTFLAALTLRTEKRWTHLAVVWVDDDPATHHGYALADNRTAELSGWNQPMLDELIGKYREDWGSLLEDVHLDELLSSIGEAAGEEDAADLPAEAPGDVVPDSFQVVAYCKTPEQQAELRKELENRGIRCRMVTL